jgi:hypothetical protein
MESAGGRKHDTEEMLADADDKDGDATPARGGQKGEPPQLQKLSEKEKLVNQLNTRLVWWHQQLDGRRASLDRNNAHAVREFNADAAAYAGFHEIAKEKNQELLTLRSVAKR